MKREQWEPKHTINLALALAALTAVVLLAIFADGAHITSILAFVGGLLVPGSPVPAFVGSKEK
jgi:hypothetical protein